MKQILKKVIISEKSFLSVSKDKFTFAVDANASKEDIAKIAEKMFGITVLKVNTANIIGKIKSTKRIVGRRADMKKAILTLKKGDKIDLFDVETEKGKDGKKEDKKSEKAKVEHGQNIASEKTSKGVETKITTRRKVTADK